LEQSVDTLKAKFDYLSKNEDSVIEETKQDGLGICVSFIYPNYAMEYSLPLTISPMLSVGEAGELINYPLIVHANYLIKAEELMAALPSGTNLSFVPPAWNATMYLPMDVYSHFVNTLGKMVKLGTLVFLSELDQTLIENQKKLGCYRYSFYGRHLLTKDGVTTDEYSKIIEIIKNNPDCEFVFSTDDKNLIAELGSVNNVQISVNQTFWGDKLN
ncbi:MAG: hypothetical protein ACRCXZ_07000, partial [Patescibacteria group bacterium]